MMKLFSRKLNTNTIPLVIIAPSMYQRSNISTKNVIPSDVKIRPAVAIIVNFMN